MNSRVTKKERGLIKGALRRVFSRSELRAEAVAKTIVPTSQVPVELRNQRKRVKTWAQCPSCKGYKAKSDMEVDHEQPVVPIDSSLQEMTANELVDRIWCKKENLTALCPDCHYVKTAAENKARRLNKKGKK